MGMSGGLVMGGVFGYWYGHQSGSNTSASAIHASSALNSSTSQQSDVPAQTKDAIVEKVNPAVVTIENRQPGPESAEQTVSMGSGFIIDAQGHIVTNNHVVDGADALVVVLLDGTKLDATLVGTDAFQDVAVVKVNGTIPATVNFGDSGAVRSGQTVIAIGSALGEFRNTVTDGIIGGVSRSLDTGDGYLLGNLIQHDAPINPGNSGGPLLNLNGDVIGMNTAVVRGGFGQSGAEGLGFAIASNTVKEYADELIAKGKVDHPYLGVSFRPVNSALGGAAPTDAQPVIIVNVEPNGPADRAGVTTGDRVVAVDGVTLDGEHGFLNEVYKHQPGEEVTLTVQHQDGSQDAVKVTLGSRPDTTT